MGEPIEIELVALAFGLFLLPRIFERFYVPSAISAFLFGILYNYLGLSLQSEQTITFLSILGISALFLLAGIEVELDVIRKNWRILAVHLLLRSVLIGALNVAFYFVLNLSLTASTLASIAVVTPSTGFILDAISAMPLSDEQKFWVKTKAISAELLALALMFFVMQGRSPAQFAFAAGGLVGVVALLPPIFKLFAKIVAPHAKNSEFSFFIMLAVIVGVATKKLGMYYLVGAFIVGLSVQRFEHLFPVMNLKKIFSGLKLFCSFFIPFYFFRSGGGVAVSDFSVSAWQIGLALVSIILPLRVLIIIFQRHWQFREEWRQSLPIALALSPTLVFGLVIAGILKTDYGLSTDVYGGLIIYTVLATFLPGLLLKNTRIQDVPEPFEILESSPSSFHRVSQT